MTVTALMPCFRSQTGSVERVRKEVPPRSDPLGMDSLTSWVESPHRGLRRPPPGQCGSSYLGH